MYFIQHNVRLLKSAFAVPVWLRYSLMVVLWIVIFCLWYFFAYQSLCNIEKRYKQDIITLQDQSNQLALQEKKFKDLDQECFLKKNVIQNNFQQQLLFEQRIEKLLHLLQEYNLALDSYSPSNEIKKAWYIEIPISFKVHGKFENVVAFLEALLNFALGISIKSVTIQKIPNDLLQVSLLFHTFIIKENNNV